MSDTSIDAVSALHTTALTPLHVELGARMVPFAGYSMPVQYPQGLMAEHHHTRQAAGLFDVSHMGQVCFRGPNAAAALESLIPMDVIDLGVNKQRYGLLLNDAGGIIDDLMFVRRTVSPTATEQELFVIVNGACKHTDLAWMRERIGHHCEIDYLPEQALLALQGPGAVAALAQLVPGVQALVFMTGGWFAWGGQHIYVTRSGYTGEDGCEISIPPAVAPAFARALLALPEVKPIGLGARNSLRLEAGLCLYGNDIDTTTNPVEAALTWAIQKVRRTGGERALGYSGAQAVQAQLDTFGAGGAAALSRRRVGLVAQERVPVRDGTPLHDATGKLIGSVTSGTLGPTVNQCIAMGYVTGENCHTGHLVFAMVRGKFVPMQVCAMPFTPNRYHRGT